MCVCVCVYVDGIMECFNFRHIEVNPLSRARAGQGRAVRCDAPAEAASFQLVSVQRTQDAPRCVSQDIDNAALH